MVMMTGHDLDDDDDDDDDEDDDATDFLLLLFSQVERTLKEKSDLLLSLSLARKVLEDEENKFKEEKTMMMEKIR